VTAKAKVKPAVKPKAKPAVVWRPSERSASAVELAAVDVLASLQGVVDDLPAAADKAVARLAEAVSNEFCICTHREGNHSARGTGSCTECVCETFESPAEVWR
jgi:hypothetical protein